MASSSAVEPRTVNALVVGSIPTWPANIIMKKTLLTNGCSFTWGGGLDYPEPPMDHERWANVWPGILSEKIGYNDVNLSAGCGSNARIFRTTYDWITSQDPDTLSNTFAIIQFTEPSRYEFYQPEWREWAKIKIDVSQVRATSYDEQDHLQDLSQKRYETYTPEEGKYSFLSYLCATKSLLDSHNIPHAFFTYGHIEMENTTYVNQNFIWVNHNMELSTFYGMALDNWGFAENHTNGELKDHWDTIHNDGHLSHYGHREFAEYLEKKLIFNA